MLRISILFLSLGLIAFFAADLEVSTGAPWSELMLMTKGAACPDFWGIFQYYQSFINTVTFALCGVVLAVVCGCLMALFFEHYPVRMFCAFIRAIHEIFWAFLLLPIVGLNAVCGILAIAIPYSGIFAKVFAEMRQEADRRPEENIPQDSSLVSRFLYGVVPVIYRDAAAYTSYRFECALRSSTILGFIGLPTLGYHLETAFKEGLYSEAAALLYLFYLLVASLRLWARPKLVWLAVLFSLYFVSGEIHFSLDNITRFFTMEILPWPMRREGVLDGSMAIGFPFKELWQWSADIIAFVAIPGIFNTVVLSQIALAVSGVVALVLFPPAAKPLAGKISRGCVHSFLIVLRTTPEYILAYIFIILWGPSMLPAIAAIALHNGAILAYLISRNSNQIPIRYDVTSGRVNRYLFEILPRIYGQFLAFLFYRWEVIMRETAILGILGITTLGFYVDSGIADDQMDIAFLLILITALLNIGVDSLSQSIRKKLRISPGLMSCREG